METSIRRVMVKFPADVDALGHAELVKLARDLWAVVQAQQAELEEHRRAAKRQAAPFSKGKKDGKKKRPGRKKGQGLFTSRQPPAPEEVTEHVEVPSPTTCPRCGAGTLVFDHFEDAYTVDLPDHPTPEVTHFRSAVSHCGSCGKLDIRGSHPKLAPDQRGATACRVGPKAFAAAHVIHYGLGVPVRKTPAILAELTGVVITQSAITQHALRQAERPALCAKYQRLRDAIRQAPIAQTDDTGYRVNGDAAQLMAFATPDTPQVSGITVYQIRRQHRNEEVREIIPSDFQGVMVTDRGRAYDAKELDEVKQQKCIFHVGRSIAEALETKTGVARNFGVRLIDLLEQALRHWHRWHRGTRRGWHVKAARIADAITVHLRQRKLKDDDNRRLLSELGYHNDRGNLTRFLQDPNIPPTNNLSERELRLPIQARKVSHCSKNDRGARAAESHASVIRTEQRKHPPSLVAAVLPFLCAPLSRAPPPPS